MLLYNWMGSPPYVSCREVILLFFFPWVCVAKDKTAMFYLSFLSVPPAAHSRRNRHFSVTNKSICSPFLLFSRKTKPKVVGLGVWFSLNTSAGVALKGPDRWKRPRPHTQMVRHTIGERSVLLSGQMVNAFVYRPDWRLCGSKQLLLQFSILT